MRIAMFVYNACTADQRVLKSAATLSAEGHELTIIAVADGIAPSEEQRGRLEIQRIQRDPVHYRLVRWVRAPGRRGRPRRTASHGSPKAAGGAGAPLAWPRLRRRGRRALFLLHKPLTYLDWYRRAAAAARAWGADAFHAHDLNTLPVAAWLAWRSGGRLVYDAHELFHEVSTLSPLERRVWRLVERTLIGRADVVITVGDSIARELASRYAIAQPRVVRNAPPQRIPVSRDPAMLRERAGLAADDARHLVLFHGGLAPFRGLEELVSATALEDGFVLVLLGDGRVRPQLEQQVADLGLTDRVRFVPPVPYDVLMPLIASADVGVIPYRAVGLNNYYSTPNKLFEYLAAGVAVIASPFPDLRAVIERFDVGTVFDAVDPEAIAAAIAWTLEDPARLERFRRNAKAAGGRFTWESEAEGLVAAYAS